MRIARLDEHPHFISALADRFASEWPAWAAGLSRAEIESVFASASGERLPLVLVAFEADRVLGTIALKPWFADAPMAETPWVRGMYVVPESRGKRVGPYLMDAVEQEAKARGFPAIHAATTRIERFLVKRGWQVFHRRVHDGEAMAWLRRDLG